MRRILPIILTGFCIISCNHKKENVTITGSFKELHPPMIYLKALTSSGVIAIDSSEINKKGEFLLHTFVTGPAFYVLWIPHSRGINLLTLPGDDIKIYIN